MVLFAGNQSLEEVLEGIAEDPNALESLIAMANVGAAFSQICLLEDRVTALIRVSKARLRSKLDSDAVGEADLFLERHQKVRRSTLGALVTVLEKSGVEGREISYLRAIVELRNDFIHRFTEQVPLPGDWVRYGYTLEEFSAYTRYVTRHMNHCSNAFAGIMVRNGLLAGEVGDFGGFLWNPDDEFLSSILGSTEQP